MALGGDLTLWLLSQLTQEGWGIPRVTLPLLSAPQQRRLTVFAEAKQTRKPWEKTSRLPGKTDAHLGQGRQMQSCHCLVPWASREWRQEPVTQVLREERGTCGGPAWPLLQPASVLGLPGRLCSLQTRTTFQVICPPLLLGTK